MADPPKTTTRPLPPELLAEVSRYRDEMVEETEYDPRPNTTYATIGDHKALRAELLTRFDEARKADAVRDSHRIETEKKRYDNFNDSLRTIGDRLIAVHSDVQAELQHILRNIKQGNNLRAEFGPLPLPPRVPTQQRVKMWQFAFGVLVAIALSAYFGFWCAKYR